MEKLKIKILSLILLTSLGIVAGYSLGIVYDYKSPKSITNPVNTVKESFPYSEDKSRSQNKERDYTVENLINYSVSGKIYNIMKKNASGKADTLGGKVYHIETNEEGLRDEPFREKPPKDTYRILVIGDSYTFGWGVNKSNRYTELLENRLNNYHNRDYQIINAGIPGWGMKDYYTFLEERGTSYHPDMVIIGVVGNDFIPHSKQTEIQNESQNQIENTYETSNMGQIRYHELVVDVMLDKLDNYKKNRSKQESDFYVYSAKIEDITEEKNISTTFYQLGRIGSRSRDILQSANIDFLEMPSSIRKNPDTYQFEEDSHYSKKAQPLLADKLYRYIKSNYSISN